LIQKDQQAISYFPPPESVADLHLRNENNASMFFALCLPLFVHETKVALWVTVVTGKYHTSLFRSLFQESAVILLHV